METTTLLGTFIDFIPKGPTKVKILLIFLNIQISFEFL